MPFKFGNRKLNPNGKCYEGAGLVAVLLECGDWLLCIRLVARKPDFDASAQTDKRLCTHV